MLPSSLDAPLAGQPEGATLADVLGQEDPAVERALMMQALGPPAELPRREQRILLMRFYSEMTQSQIGERLGISQMHVSRLLAHAIGYLHERILGTPPEHRSAPQPPGRGGRPPVRPPASDQRGNPRGTL